MKEWCHVNLAHVQISYFCYANILSSQVSPHNNFLLFFVKKDNMSLKLSGKIL
jgi:hypothetical protein